ncbi:MAG: bifunctional precorrin-2 dehydrogenase/sirohydrochlorin ferrochelatase [Chloroflexota bacterium]
MQLYPVFLRLDGRRCVVVGGGAVGTRRARTLLDCGADVLVVAPTVTAELDALEEQGALRIERRSFAADRVDGAFLVIAATDDGAVNASALSAGRAAGALVASARSEDGAECVIPSVARRGSIAIAISTSGRSPAFARRLREEMEDWLTDDRVAALEAAAEERTRRLGGVAS